MLHFIITLLLSLGSTVNPEITEQEAKVQLETEHNIKASDWNFEDIWY
jgi:hypothetical protein